MKAIVCDSFGEINKVMSMSSDYSKPSITDSSPGYMLIRVLACSISPGDGRSIDGSVDYMRTPPSFPWIPGHDVCGVVESVRDDDEHATHFKINDVVVSTSSKALLMGGLAEYALVETAHAAIVPSTISPMEAACLPTSAQRALQAIRQADIKPGDRVLVLGATGGFGSFLLPLLKHYGAYVVGTTTQVEFCKSLGADLVLNYQEQHWWEMEEFVENPFDVIMDCECDRKGLPTPWSLCSRVVKNGRDGGTFLAVTMDDPDMQIHSFCGILSFLFPVLSRVISTSLCTKRSPKYRMLASAQNREDLYSVFELIENGVVKVVFDDSSTKAPMTEKSVRDAFHAVANKHARGKICIEISTV